ncbi:hypothetical protein Rhopal_007590-T1 [Rhodotorula paludigena]|uniref:Proteophosphoglycan ppg4 n=1 Tax=Rhodotorula paludigena TaxID=86838 RepID=A0AAV5H1A0_9BASI|nr:hypothetical protein Rhopal_007590-T1 [Rhodotorula paludigena]
MLTLQILPAHGNVNNFSFSGILGVSDVVVRGRVAAGLDERASGKAPEVRRIVVRLVRLDAWDGKAFKQLNKEVVDEATLWTPADGADAERLQPSEHRFLLRVPRDAKGLSKMQFKVGACQASVFWRLEAYAETVKNGRIDAQQGRSLNLIRHASTSAFPADVFAHAWSSAPSSTSPVPFDYDLRIPNEPFGVTDAISVDSSFRLPANSGVTVKSFKLWLRRDVLNLKTGARFETTHEFAPEEEAPVIRPSHDRKLHGRTPSPPSELEGPSPHPHRFPIVASDAVDVFERGRFRMRIPGQGPHRWTVGETGESSLFTVSFALVGKITYKLRSGGTSKIELPPVPIYVYRRNSDFALQLKLGRTAPVNPSAPPLPSPSAICERRLSATHLPLPSPTRMSPIRPCQGRRMSEHGEAHEAPARTRVRRDPPAPLPLPNNTLAPSPSQATPVSRSSTIETLGPDTPCTLEFLHTTSPPSPSHLSPKVPSYSHFSPGHAPYPPRHGQRSSRSSGRYRPRSAGSQRSSILGESARSVSNLSIASLASVSTKDSDALSTRDLSVPLSSASSATMLASADRMTGLSLVEMAAPSDPAPAGILDDGDSAMLEALVQAPLQPSASPPVSPEPASPIPDVEIADMAAFSNPFAAVLAKTAMAGTADRSVSRAAASEMYVSPRDARRASRTDVPSPPLVAPSPRFAQVAECLAPPLIEAKSADSSRRGSLAPVSPNPHSQRKGSIGVFISNILGRRGSKSVPAQ